MYNSFDYRADQSLGSRIAPAGRTALAGQSGSQKVHHFFLRSLSSHLS